MTELLECIKLAREIHDTLAPPVYGPIPISARDYNSLKPWLEDKGYDINKFYLKTETINIR